MERDWLNAEWVENHLDLYKTIKQEVRHAIANAGVATKGFMNSSFVLRAPGKTREQLVEAVVSVVAKLELKIDAARSIDTSKTIGGLIDDLIDQIRLVS